MTRQQRISIGIIGIVLLIAGGRFRLFNTLKDAPEEVGTNMQPEAGKESSPLEENTGGTSGKNGVSGDILNHVNNETGQALPDLTAPEATQVTGSLTVLLPPRFSAPARQALAERIDQEHLIQIKVFQPKTLATYLKAITIMSSGSRQADIMLVPRNETTQLQGRWLITPRQHSPAPWLHPQLAPLLEDKKLTFFPYAIDPRVTVLSDPKTISSLTLASLLQEITIRKQLLPLWISAEAIGLLEQHQEPRTRFVRIVSLWLDQLTQADAPEIVPLLLRIQQPQDTPCFDKVSCLSSSSELSALRLPLSQLETEQPDPTAIHITNFPSLTSRAPADVRWRVINKRSPQLQASAVRMQSYLKLLTEDQLPYHERLLPVLHTRFQRLLLQPARQRLGPIAYRRERLTTSTTKSMQQLQTTPFLELLQGSYNPAIFLTTREKTRKE